MDAQELQKLARLERSHWWYSARRAMLRREVAGLPPGRALDVGAGAGGNTEVLVELGWRATAVELSPTGSAIARRRGINTVRADATGLPFADGTFDLLVAMDLWEHIPDDHLAAQEAFRVLRPDGRLYVAVPADMSLWSGHDAAVDHVRRYDRAELVALAESVGFRVTRVQSWNVLLRPVAKWRRGRSATAAESDLDSVPAPLNAALRMTVELERWLPVGRLPGVSLVLQAERSRP